MQGLYQVNSQQPCITASGHAEQKSVPFGAFEISACSKHKGVQSETSASDPAPGVNLSSTLSCVLFNVTNYSYNVPSANSNKYSILLRACREISGSQFDCHMRQTRTLPPRLTYSYQMALALNSKRVQTLIVTSAFPLKQGKSRKTLDKNLRRQLLMVAHEDRTNYEFTAVIFYQPLHPSRLSFLTAFNTFTELPLLSGHSRPYSQTPAAYIFSTVELASPVIALHQRICRSASSMPSLRTAAFRVSFQFTNTEST